MGTANNSAAISASLNPKKGMALMKSTNSVHPSRSLYDAAKTMTKALVLAAALFGLPAASALAEKAGISIDDVKLDAPDFKNLFGMAPKPVLKGIT